MSQNQDLALEAFAAEIAQARPDPPLPLCPPLPASAAPALIH